MIRELLLEDLSLWGCVWQSTLFAVLGLAGSFLLRRRPSRACQVLFLAMVAAVVVPTMSILVKHFELGVFTVEPIVLKPEATLIDYEASGAVPRMDMRDEVSMGAGESASVKTSSESANIPLRTIVLYGWMMATLILLGRLFAAFVSGVCLLRRAQSRGCEQIQRAADFARAKLGITKDLQVRSSKDVRSPVIWCLSKTPVLLVPGHLDDGVDWVGVTSHELAHWRRWDHISGLIAELIVCILSWNPLLWWSKKRMVRLSEQACDDWVVASGQPCENYAQSLLNFKPQKQAAFVPAILHSKRGLAGRIRRILKDSCGNPRTGTVWALAVSLVAVCLAVGVACAQTRPAKTEAATERQGKHTKSLHKAVADGDIEQVKSLIAKGADVNAKDENGRTPLHFAAGRGHREVAKLLIAHGADVNASIRDESWTPLLDAVSQGHTKIVKLLLEKGAKVDVGDRGGYTPLYYALWNEDQEMVRMLISGGADVDKRASEGDPYNPFFYAVWAGDVGLVKAFIDADADVNYEDKGGWMALHYALWETDIDVVKQFVGAGVKIPDLHKAVLEGDMAKIRQLVESGTDVDTRDKPGWTPSYWALSTGQKKVFAYLLSRGADVTAKTNGGHTLLHHASKAGFIEIVRQLIARGADVSVKDKGGVTPLQCAASEGHKEVVKLLVAKGADVNTTSNNGKHALGDAAVAGHEDVVKLLIASGAEVNLHAEDSGTALHAAAQGSYSTILDLLIAKGADVNINSRSGTPLHLATRNRSKRKVEKCAEIVEKLLAKGADVNVKEPRQSRTPLHNAARWGHCKAAELLITAGADVNAMSNNGHTPLWYAKKRYAMNEDGTRIVELLRRHGAVESLYDAAEGGDISQVKRLISKGADVNAKTDGLITPIYEAVRMGRKEICELLIAKGAEVNVKGKAGGTPLHVACTEGHQEVAKLLLAHGADIDAKTDKGHTPLSLAKEKGHDEIVELLQKHGAKEGISLQD